jgi:hypothetical protein
MNSKKNNCDFLHQNIKIIKGWAFVYIRLAFFFGPFLALLAFSTPIFGKK